MAKQLAKIYVSEYVRIAQTIAYVAQKMKLSPIVDGRLNEIDNGVADVFWPLTQNIT